MLEKIDSHNLHIADHGWLLSRFHFSFSNYYNPLNMNFGVLRVLNDDLVQPKTGFGTHPHQDMEIVSYCVEGKMTHRDSMGSKESLERGDVQYMTAGTGITHSEMNESTDKLLRFLQIWILPNKKERTPQYGSRRFTFAERHNKFLQIVSAQKENGAIHLSQDANIFVSELDSGKRLEYVNESDRQSYLVCIEGSLNINGIKLNKRDAMEITGKEQLIMKALSEAHFLVIEMGGDVMKKFA